MTHEAFDHIGERVMIVDSTNKIKEGIIKEGIFQESTDYQTKAEGVLRPALDFIVPIYNPHSGIEELAWVLDHRVRVHPENPILSLHRGVDHLKLQYIGRMDNVSVFQGELIYRGAFLHDSNSEVFDKYKDALKNAGFKVK